MLYPHTLHFVAFLLFISFSAQLLLLLSLRITQDSMWISTQILNGSLRQVFMCVVFASGPVLFE